MSFKLTREMFIPKNSTKVSAKNSSAVAYIYEVAGKPIVKTFLADRAKADKHYNFKTMEKLEQWLTVYFKEQAEIEARKAAYKAERKAEAAKPHPLTVGHVLYASWGYDQTNIDFYEVVEVVGRHTVKIRELAQISEGDGFGGNSKCYPKMGAYKGDAEIRRARADGTIRLESYKHATIWDGQSKYWSADH